MEDVIISSVQQNSFWKDVLMELIGPGIQVIIGILGFMIFQNYRSKKHTGELYLQVFLLKEELKKSKKELESFQNDYIEYELRYASFGQEKSDAMKIRKLCKSITNLQLYQRVESSYMEEPDIFFEEVPNQAINELRSEISNGDCDQEEFNNYQEMISKYQNMNIYQDLENLEETIGDKFEYEFDYVEIIRRFYEKLCKYNKLLKSEKKRELQKFCDNIFHGEGELAVFIREYKDLKRNTKKYNAGKKVKFKYCQWDEIDKSIFVEYNVERVIDLDVIYNDLNVAQVRISNYEELKTYNERILELERILNKDLKILSRSLKMANKIRKGV